MSIQNLITAPEYQHNIGLDNADNEASTTNVVANADGSILERLENVQQDLNDVKGMAYMGACASGMSASQTAITISALAGYGEDFFNTNWVMVCLHNINSDGTAPEGEIRDITDYVTATGAFTVAAFSANAEAGDQMLVARRELFTTDGVALQTTPTTNSLAYRLSQFIATGDGDFADGQPLPSNTSLVDVLGNFTGPYDGTAADDNVKAALDLIAAKPLSLGNTMVRKTVAFDGSAGNGAVGTVALFTVTGTVLVRLTCVCTETLTDAGNTATVEVGITGATATIIAQTGAAGAGGVTIAVGEIWHDNAPDASIEAASVLKEFIITAGSDIFITVGTEAVTDGTLEFACAYEALSADGAVVAA